MTDTDTTRQLPPDPEGMNENRAVLAGKALNAFIAASGADEEDVVGDLLIDLMHWCDRNNHDFDLALDRARSHYDAETSSKDASTAIPTYTPWGKPDSMEKIAPGIVRFHTPSHGGYWLSPERVAEMPKPLREFKPFAGPNWYEEDADWSIVALAFPHLFPADAFCAALETLKHCQPELYEQIASRRADSQKLSKERLEAIWTELTQAEQGAVAEELRKHVAVLEDAIMCQAQYYEEFVIPEIEGRPVGKWSAGRLRRDDGPAR